MPIYEYKCKDCKAKFEYLSQVNNKEKIICPGCESKDVEKTPSTFSDSSDKGGSCSSCHTCPGCGEN